MNSFKCLSVAHSLIGNESKALCTAEKGRARALADLMASNYLVLATDADTTRTMCIDDLKPLAVHAEVPIVFISFLHHKFGIYLWILQKDGSVHLRISHLDRHHTLNESFESLTSAARKEIGVGGAVRCEDRSLEVLKGTTTRTKDVRRDRSGASMGNTMNVGDAAQSFLDAKSAQSKLTILYEALIAPIANMLASANKHPNAQELRSKENLLNEGESPSSQRLPSEEKLHNEGDSPSSQKLPSEEKLLNEGESPSSQKLPSEEKLLNEGESPSSQKLPGEEKLHNEGESPSSQKLPSEENLHNEGESPNSQKLPSEEKVPSSDILPSAQNLLSTEKFPTEDKVACEEKHPSADVEIPGAEKATNVKELPSVIFVPDGHLFLAPFAAFKDGNRKYLSESFRIRVVPSLMTLKLIYDSPIDYHSQSGALIVGDPDVGRVSYEGIVRDVPRLPFAKQEAEMIADTLKVKALIGEQATKSEVLKRISAASLFHVAAHGDMQSGEIALSPNPKRSSRVPCKEDFMLCVSDLAGIRLHAKLVVLSCCHSGEGEIKAEGVIGIARMFLGVGARAVLVALWAIDDEATLYFMKSFYECLVLGHSTSHALNQAMKHLRESEEFNAPRFWSPFRLIGDDVKFEFHN